MTGLAMLLKSFGVNIDPAAIEKMVRQEIPDFARALMLRVQQMDARLAAIEQELRAIREERCQTSH